MENLTLEQFLKLSSLGFSTGFVVGLSLWAVRKALGFVSYSVTGRSTLGVD